MRMKKILVIALVISTIGLMAVGSYSISGFFSKAFDKTLSPGEVYEKNITVRKFYNLTVRFQKEGSTSYLSFDNNETEVILKDSSGNEILRLSDVQNGRVYALMEKAQLNTVKFVSATRLEQYQDVSSQNASISFSGTTAYLTISVINKPGTILGYVSDELTGNIIQGVNVLAFSNDADPNIESPIAEDTTDANGKYLLSFQLNSSKSLDIYVRDYTTS